MKAPLLVHGMHGLGDNLHQRALIRQWLPKYDVYLESSWVAPYHDLIADGLKVVRKRSRLRTQDKNAERENALFYTGLMPPLEGRQSKKIWYPPHRVRECGSVLAAMCATVDCDFATADFRLPLPAAWCNRVQYVIGDRNPSNKPIMIYRPLVERTEWSGCPNRNPDHESYAALYDSIRDKYFVISVADLVPGVEWQVGLGVEVDMRFHEGELPFETLAALFARASMVFASPGFAIVLAQAVGTPSVCVYGGYEGAHSFDAGARQAPYLPLAPMHPCACFSHEHECDKRMNMKVALRDLRRFTEVYP